SKAIEIANWLINAFRKTIWQEWCTQRKKWEKRHLQHRTHITTTSTTQPTSTSLIQPTSTSSTPNQQQTNQIIDQILCQKRKKPTLICHPINISQISSLE